MNNNPKKLGRYQILSELGRGAMGVVYKAHDPVIERDVAVKAIQLAFQVGPEEKQVYLNRFYREAKAAGKLNHPNIVTIYDVDEDKETGTPFIVMEYLEGTTLQEIINDGILLPVQDTGNIIMQIADALHYAHKQGVVHRDVKSANIILVEGMKAKIMDFGIARLSTSDLTKSGQFIGTPNYMSPEQIDGKSIVDGRSDLFALGVIFYLLLTGERPFSGDSFTSISYKIVHVEPIPPRTVNPAVPEAYNRILGKLLAKNPGERFNNGAELIEELKKVGTVPQEAEQSIPIEEPTLMPAESIDQPSSLDDSRKNIASHRTLTVFPGQKIPKPALVAAVVLLVVALVAVASLILHPVDTAPVLPPPVNIKPATPDLKQAQKDNEIRMKLDLAINYEKNGFYDKSIQQVQEILILEPNNAKAKEYLKDLQAKKDQASQQQQ